MKINQCIHLGSTDFTFFGMIVYQEIFMLNRSLIEQIIIVFLYCLAALIQVLYLKDSDLFRSKPFYLPITHIVKFAVIWLSLEELGTCENVLLIYQFSYFFASSIPKDHGLLNCFNSHQSPNIQLVEILFFIQWFALIIQYFVNNAKAQLPQPNSLTLHQSASGILHLKKTVDDFDDEPWLQYKWLFNEKIIVLSSNLSLKHINFELSRYMKGENLTDRTNEFYVTKLLQQPIKHNENSYQRLQKRFINLQTFLEEKNQNSIFEHIFHTINIQGNQFDLANFNLNIMGIQFKQENYFLIHFVANLKNSKDTNTLIDICRSLSHELGTCLNLIQTLSSSALQDDEIEINIKENYFKQIQCNCQQLNLIISNFRDFSASEIDQIELSLSQFDISLEIQEIVSYFKDTCDLKNIRLILPFDPGNDIFILYYQSKYSMIGHDSSRYFIRYFIMLLGSHPLELLKWHSKIKMDIFRYLLRILEQEWQHILQYWKNQEEQKLLSGVFSNGTLQRVSRNSNGASLGLFISNTLLKRINRDESQSGQLIQFNSYPQKGSLFYFNIKNMSDALDNVSKIRSQDQSCSIIRLQSINSFYDNRLNQEYRQKRMAQKKSTFRSLISPKLQNISFGEDEQDSIYSQDVVESQSDQVVVGQLPVMTPKFQEDIRGYGIKTKCCSRVLIVDDEYFNIIALQSIMKKFNTICDYAFNGQDALNLIMRKKQQICASCRNRYYQLIFLDISMPIMGGVETVKNIRAIMSQTLAKQPLVIANTGFTDLETRLAAYDAGMDYYLSKPIDTTDLVTIIRQHFGR